MAGLSAYVDFRNAIEDLADAAPDDLDDEYDTVRAAFSTFPDVSNPVAAIAGALFTGVNLTIAFDRIDATTQELCGVTLFGLNPGAVTTITTPYVDEDGYTVVDARNLFGTRVCSAPGQVIAASSDTRLVLDCGEGHVVGIDLDAYKTAWSRHTTFDRGRREQL